MVSLVRVTVKIVGAVVCRKLVLHAINGKACIVYTVRARPHRRAEKRTVCKIPLNAVVSQYHIHGFSCLVRHEKFYEDCAEIRDRCREAVIVRDGVELHLCPVSCLSKIIRCDCHFCIPPFCAAACSALIRTVFPF